MSIQFNNGIINVKGTPGVITDTLANRPNANSVLLGTIFFSTDNNIIYQVHTIGALQGWAVMGGGGGGTQNLDNVLFQGGQFTSDRLSNLNNFDWTLYNVNDFVIKFVNNNYWDFNENKFAFYNTSGITNLIEINTNNGNIFLGDVMNQFNENFIEINQSPYNSVRVVSEGQEGILIAKNYVSIGDVNQTFNGVYFLVDNLYQKIKTYLGFEDTIQTAYGFNTEYTNLIASLGDYNNENNKTKIEIIDVNSEMFLQSPNGTIYIGDGVFQNTGNSLQILNGAYSQIVSYFAGQQYGIEIDYNNVTTKIGDFAGNNQFTQIEIYDSTREIYLQSGQSIYIGDRKLYSGGMYLNIDTTGNVINAIDYNANVPFGIQLLMNTYDFYFGDFSGQIHGANLRVTGGGDITTYGLIGGGMNAYGFTTSINGNYTKLGDFLQYKTWTTFEINDNAEPIIYTKFYGQNWGIKILNQDLTNATDNIAVLGDHRGTPTNIALRLNYLGNTFNVDNVDEINLNGNILSGTAGGNSGQHLIITINGNDYKITLLNP